MSEDIGWADVILWCTLLIGVGFVLGQAVMVHVQSNDVEVQPLQPILITPEYEEV